MKAVTAIISSVILMASTSARSDWQRLDGTRDMQKGKDDSNNELSFSFYSELDEIEDMNTLYGTF